MKRYLMILVALMIGAGIIASCEKKNEEESYPVQLNILMLHYVDDHEVVYDNIQYTNAFGNQYSVARLQYFVSDFRFFKTDGTEVFIDEEHYVDGLDESTYTFSPEKKLPPGQYDRITFVFGLNEAKNITGRYPNPPESNMEWPVPMGGGYHYMKLEGKVDSAGVINNFQAHTGPTMGNKNYIEVELSGFAISPTGMSVTIPIVMDINKWWESPNIFDLNLMTSVMGNQEVQQKLHDNGHDVFHYEPLITIDN